MDMPTILGQAALAAGIGVLSAVFARRNARKIMAGDEKALAKLSRMTIPIPPGIGRFPILEERCAEAVLSGSWEDGANVWFESMAYADTDEKRRYLKARGKLLMREHRKLFRRVMWTLILFGLVSPYLMHLLWS